MSKSQQEIFEANKQLWNEKTDGHVASEFYDNESFLKGRNTLNDIEMEYLDDIKNKSILHIQCHFGQDSISLARMGGKVTGTDISDKAIEKARELNKACGTDAEFIECNTYNLDEVITKKYDIIFMSYGVLTWLPSIQKLADIIVPFLKPGGKILSIEFHPMLYTFDFPTGKIAYGYNNVKMYEEDVEGSYTDKTENIRGKEYFWQHSLEEVASPFIDHGLRMSALREYYYSPYNCHEGMKEVESGKFVYGDFPYPIPHHFLFQFTKDR